MLQKKWKEKEVRYWDADNYTLGEYNGVFTVLRLNLTYRERNYASQWKCYNETG